MAIDTAASTSVWGFVIGIGIACLLVGAVVGHYAYPTVLEGETNNITTIKEVPASELVIGNDTYNADDIKALEAQLTDLKTEFNDDIRENEIIEIAKDAISSDYMDDLDFDDDLFKDSTFKLVWVEFDLTEDEGDYEVFSTFIIMEYNDDHELINQHNANATLDVKEVTDVVKHLEIGLAF